MLESTKMRRRKVLTVGLGLALAGAAAGLVACGGDGSDHSAAGGSAGQATGGSGGGGGTGGGGTGASAGASGSGASAGTGATGGSAGTPSIASCEAAACPSYDCDCQDGSLRKFRSCSAASAGEACQTACEGLGGVGQPTPGTPQQTSVGKHIGETCTHDFDCDPFALMCETWSSQFAGAKCVVGKCADYAGTVQATCAVGPKPPAVDATGSRFLRGCGSIESVHFWSDATQPTEARLLGVVSTVEGFRAVGHFRGRIRLGAEDETCLGGGLFVAELDHESRPLAKKVRCDDHAFPVVTEDGIYVAVQGKASLNGGQLLVDSAPGIWSLVKYDFSLTPQWARVVAVPAGKGISVYGAKTGVYLRAQVPVQLWDNATTTDLQTLVRIDSAGQVAFSVVTTAKMDEFTTSGDHFAIRASSDTPTFTVNGQNYTEPSTLFNFTMVFDDQGALQYVAAANALNVAQDGSGVQARSGDNGERILERFDAQGKLSWSKVVAKISTPHLYYGGSLASPYVLPDGRMVGWLSLSMDETTNFAGKQLSGENAGMRFMVQFSADGTPHAAERIRPCYDTSLRDALVTGQGDLVQVGEVRDCGAAYLKDINWPLVSTYPDANAGFMVRYRPLP